MKVCIGIARIKGLNKELYYFKEKCFWAFDIMLPAINGVFGNLPFICLSQDYYDEALENCNKIKKEFRDAGICENDKVVVLHNERGNVRAIGTIGKDCWIDVDDKFVRKTFKELEIEIDSLIVK